MQGREYHRTYYRDKRATVSASCCTRDHEPRYSLAERERETGLLGSLGKENIGHAEVTDGELVAGDEALHRARAILDRECGAVGLVRRRRTGVILGVEEARDRRALDAGNPEVRGAGVEVDGELLGGGTDGDRADPVTIVRLVGQRLTLTLGKVRGELRDGLDDGTLLEDMRADVLLKVEQVRAVLAVRRGRGELVRLVIYPISKVDKDMRT